MRSMNRLYNIKHALQWLDGFSLPHNSLLMIVSLITHYNWKTINIKIFRSRNSYHCWKKREPFVLRCFRDTLNLSYLFFFCRYSCYSVAYAMWSCYFHSSLSIHVHRVLSQEQIFFFFKKETFLIIMWSNRNFISAASFLTILASVLYELTTIQRHLQPISGFREPTMSYANMVVDNFLHNIYLV